MPRSCPGGGGLGAGGIDCCIMIFKYLENLLKNADDMKLFKPFEFSAGMHRRENREKESS